MKLFERRSPIAWSLIVAGAVFASLVVYAIATGQVVVPGRRGSSSEVILREAQPDRFTFHLRFFTTACALFWFLAIVRLAPFEDGIKHLRTRSREAISRKGYDRDRAPVWAYVFLAVFIGAIIWIGKVTMYSE